MKNGRSVGMSIQDIRSQVMRVGFLAGDRRVLQLHGCGGNPAHIHYPVVAFTIRPQRIFQDLQKREKTLEA